MWWGKYMTSFQMTQFVSMLAQGIYCTLYSDYPKWLSQLIVVYMVTLLILFLLSCLSAWPGIQGLLFSFTTLQFPCLMLHDCLLVCNCSLFLC